MVQEEAGVGLGIRYINLRNGRGSIALILLMGRGRVYRTFPIFFLYLCWSLFSDSFLYYVRIALPYATFYQIYRVQLIVDSLMIFALLVEVAWSVSQPHP